MLIAAFNMRIAIAEVGPLIEQIRADTGMSSALAGALTTVPFLCMSAFALGASALVRRRGVRMTMVGGLVAIGAGIVLRAAMPTPLTLVAATVPIGVGMAVVGVCIPVIIKLHFAGRSGAVTSGYTLAMAAGITVVGAAIVPLAELVGSWRTAFALTAVPAVAGVVLALAADLRDEDPATEAVAQPDEDPATAEPGAHRDDRSVAESGAARDHGRRFVPPALAVRLGLVFGMQSFCYAAMIGWSAAIYQDAGYSERTAALAIASLGILAVIASVATANLAEHADRRLWLSLAIAGMAVGLAGIAIAPGGIGLVWMVVFGLATGAVLPLVFMLPIALGTTSRSVGELTAWMLAIGYAFSALGPPVVGALRDGTGGFGLPLAVMIAISLAAALLALTIPRRAPG